MKTWGCKCRGYGTLKLLFYPSLLGLWEKSVIILKIWKNYWNSHHNKLFAEGSSRSSRSSRTTLILRRFLGTSESRYLSDFRANFIFSNVDATKKIIIIIINIDAPGDSKVSDKEKKVGQNLKMEIKKIWNMTSVIVVSVIVGALRGMIKSWMND